MKMKFNVNKKIILASGSPRRKELLAMLNIPFEVVTSNIIENSEEMTTKNFVRYAESLAVKKAEAVAQLHPNTVVLGADTIVGLGTYIFTKPENEAEAKLFLQMLSGKTHSVVTSVAIIMDHEKYVFSDETKVTFYELEEALIDEYVKTGDPLDKAGGYGIQSLGALFIKEIQGDYYAVMGLPIASVLRHLRSLGVLSLQGGATNK